VGNKILLFTSLVIVGHSLQGSTQSHGHPTSTYRVSYTHNKEAVYSNVEHMTDIAMGDNYWFNYEVRTLLIW